MVKNARHIIRIFLLLLMLTVGVGSPAWGKITYHILSLPFDTYQRDGTDNIQGSTVSKFKSNVRVEAFCCWDNDQIVGLPTEYKSPLIGDANYHYYYESSITKSTNPEKLYGYTNSTYYLYTINGSTGNPEDNPTNEDYSSDYVPVGTELVGDYDIYVTYTYDPNDAGASMHMDLSATRNYTGDGMLSSSQAYNIRLRDRMLVLNQNRQNRPGAVKDGYYTEEDLTSDDFRWIEAGGLKNTAGYRFFKFQFGGNDPYNVTIYTAYNNSTTYRIKNKNSVAFEQNVTHSDYDKYIGKNTNVYKEYRGSSFFAKLNNGVVDGNNMWLSSEADLQWTDTWSGSDNAKKDNATIKVVPGYFKGPNDNKSTKYEMSPIFNSFAILNHKDGGYVLAASKMNVGNNTNSVNNWQPRASDGAIQYLDYDDDGNNVKLTYRKPSETPSGIIPYEIYTYTFKVKTPFGNILTATRDWSEADASSSLKDHVPDALLRKYVTFTGAYAEIEVAGVKQADTSTPISSFADAENYGRVIWLEYTTSMPFKTLPANGDYDDVSADIYNSDNARWYTLRMNGASEVKNLVYLNSDIFSTGLGSNVSGQLHQGENSAAAQFAFIGDPFELRIINRAASETAEVNKYVGCATGATLEETTMSPKSGSSDTCRWEIVPGSVSSPDYMILRQFNTTDKYIGWNSSASTVIYSGTASTIRVVELGTKAYVYHIVRSDGSIAVKATASQDIGVPLTLNNIPEIIRSPFIGSNNSFYWTIGDATATPSPTNPKTNGSYELSSEYDIYVRYNSPITSYIDGDNYNVRLNGAYIYYDSNSSTVKSSATIADKDEDGTTKEYLWTLSGSDPYAMTVQNVANDNKFVMIADGDDEGTEPDWDNGTISWSVTAPTSKFIIKSTSYDRVFEVMAATGDDFADAATTYYNIGRNDVTDVTKVYSNGTYRHGYEQLRFQLTSTDAISVTYHLIDKESKDLLHITTLQEPNTPATFPDDYTSPLVTAYHYYAIDQFTDPNTSTTPVMGDATAIYHLNNSPTPYGNVTSSGSHIFVTYDVSDRYDMQNKKITYLLKYETGTPFRAEDGSDGLEATPITPVYPYCNGDCCFFIYGQAQFNLQQEGAASTRTRWAWYLESANNDPYHVKICSRQQETYNQDDIRGYFATYQPDDYDRVITTLVWPTISGIQGTEYMILGTSSLFRLETTNEIPLDSDHDKTPESTQRYTVKSFEQYWKTFDTVKKKILDGELGILADKDKGNSKYEDPDGSILVPTSPASYRESLTGLSYNYHSYKKWAYAKRFNGYNKDGETKKGWEELEHWFQTIDMGEGYFSLEAVDINPVLILLDQHGWEIMRKPLPTSPTDPTKAAKYNQIRPYNSPMVEKYYFWTKASKRTGFHQYYSLSQQVTVDGEPFTSQSLTDLPPYETSANIKDAKGNLLDQYVTYTVKDEYVQSYNPSIKEGAEFLIQQGSKFASYNGTDLSKNEVPSTGGMQQYIIENIDNLTTTGSKKNELWYVKPNARIDYEMGYVDGDEEHDIVTNHDWTDADDYAGYTDYFSDGFDPYNIQISSVPFNAKYFVTNATGATLSEGAGSLIGVYSSDPKVSIREPYIDIPCTWYDSRALAITNATFMAVQDANGNMQLMPRFDQSTRMKDFSELVPTTDAGISNTYTKLYRPLVYNYHIIDNKGNESLRYRSGGDLVPQTPNHFKSPLAKDFTYYKTLTNGVVSNEITASFASAELITAGSAGNDVYVRYSYDKEADELGVLQGRWLTIQLNAKNAIYSSGIKQASGDKPETIDASHKDWQWKFLKTPKTDPDPYAVQLFNRNNPGDNNELPTGKYFAILPHTNDGVFALAEARTTNANYDTYNFLNGDGAMDDDTPAAIARESGFLSTSCSFSGTNSQIQLNNEVAHTFIYKIYTNTGVFAISAEQDNETLVYNEYVPELPLNIKSPLLNMDQFRYYEQDLTGSVATADTLGKSLDNLYGLYDDIVYVHYTAYDPLVTAYKVPNERNATGAGQVERANTSNDASIEINDDLLYNIIWFSDNMMVGDGSTITDGGSLEIDGDPAGKVWRFAGNDPYAIKIRQNGATKYVHKSGDEACDLSETASTFMLLPRSDNYEYGMFQVTGGTGKLTGYGGALTTGEAVPTKFIIFALSTHKVTYHLVIENIGNTVNVNYPDKDHTIPIQGTTQRNLTTHPIVDHAAGHVSLGDPLKVPDDMYRTNVDYFFYVDDIYNVKSDGTDDDLNTSLTALYKGHLVKAMGKDPNLVGKHVYINIVYSFQGGLPTNAGDGFVLNVDENKWYTFEAQKADGTPLLMQFTNAWGMEVKEGRGTHYTNDYLWTPIGDPYGFKMYHRYTCVNSGNDNRGEPNRVMTTAGFTDNQEVWMDDGVTGPTKIDAATAATNSVYELLADEKTDPGYFKIHPVANSDGTQYYFKIFHDWEKPEDHTTPEHDYVRLSSDDDYTEFRFGLTEDLVKPYYDRAGYVGGLTTEAKAAYKAVDDNTSYSEAEKLMEKQKIVYDPNNIVKYEPGYYRLHSPEDIAGITVRYASGYNHKTELDYDNNASADADGDGNNVDAIPMHFYERKGVNTTFEILANGFTRSPATQGAIPISEPMYDPASVLYFYEGSSSTPLSRVQTQGLYLKGAKGPGLDGGGSVIAANVEAANVRATAVMTETEGEATSLYVMDIGGAILLIHDNVTAMGRQYLKYLSFDQNDASHIYDLKLTHNTHTDHAKWLMEPVNDQGITLSVHSGGDAGEYGTTYYYSTWYAPFDVLLPDDNDAKRYVAYLCDNGHSPWPDVNPGELHPQLMSVYNTEANGCPEGYRGSDKFIPANTPALIATTDNAGVVMMTIPTSAPSTVTIPNGNTFSGVFLEQKLEAADPVRDVYVFGLPFTSTLEKDGDYATSGNISGTLPEQAQTGAGFYINANPNKELGLSKAEWIRNNLYVLANRIYYRAAGGGSGAPDHIRDVQYVPVIFGDDEGGEEEPGGQDEENWNNRRRGDGCVYDILGRKVASEAEVKAGTWWQHLSPGIYIVDGQKVFVGVGRM